MRTVESPVPPAAQVGDTAAPATERGAEGGEKADASACFAHGALSLALTAAGQAWTICSTLPTLCWEQTENPRPQRPTPARAPEHQLLSHLAPSRGAKRSTAPHLDPMKVPHLPPRLSAALAVPHAAHAPHCGTLGESPVPEAQSRGQQFSLFDGDDEADAAGEGADTGSDAASQAIESTPGPTPAPSEPASPKAVPTALAVDRTAASPSTSASVHDSTAPSTDPDPGSRGDARFGALALARRLAACRLRVPHESSGDGLGRGILALLSRIDEVRARPH